MGRGGRWSVEGVKVEKEGKGWRKGERKVKGGG